LLSNISHETQANEMTSASWDKLATSCVNLLGWVMVDVYSYSIEIKNIVFTKVRRIIENLLDYMIQFGELVHTVMLIFKTGMFTVQDNALVFEITHPINFNLILLQEFFDTETNNDILFASTIPKDFTNTDFAGVDFSTFFQEGHLKLLHSYYFGSIGPRDASLKNHLLNV
jgi:hypothetical protein